MDELIDVVDEHGNPTGKTILKSEAHKTGALHRVAHLILHNSEKKFLSQKRSAQKTIYPGYWDISAAGHIAAGEEPEHAICRECEEEIGVSILTKDLQLITTFMHTKNLGDIQDREYYFVYAAPWNGTLSELQLQKSEVSDVQWINPYAVPEDSSYNNIRDYLPMLAKKIFE